MKYAILVFVLSIISFFSTYSQILTVFNKENQQVLELVTLSSDKPLQSAVTNSKGQANLTSFKGAEKIEIRLLGYKPLYLSYNEIVRNNYKVYLTKTGISLDEVTVTATRWNQARNEIPNRIAVVNANSISLSNPQTSADLLGNTGEIFIQKSQMGGGSPMIRGFATNRILITVDGIRMNTAIFRSGNVQNVISIDPQSIDNTEIIFGPGSVIYGSDAIGGVMSFHTHTPQLAYSQSPEVSGKTSTRYSSANNEINGHININVGWKKMAMVTSLSYSKFDDLRIGSHGPDDYLRTFYVQRIDSLDLMVSNSDPLIQKPTGYEQINLLQKLYYKPNEQWDLSYGLIYSSTSNYPRYDRLIRTRNNLPRSAEWYYGPQKWLLNYVNINNHISNKFFDQMALRLAYQYFEESRHDRGFNDTVKSHRIEKVNALSANFDYLKSTGYSSTLLYGLELVYDDVNSTGAEENTLTHSSQKGPSRYPQSSWGSYAAYLTWQCNISDHFYFQTGARYNLFTLNAIFDTTFYPFPFETADLNKGTITGSIGMVYAPSTNFSMNVNLSRGFRSPNIDDMGKVFDSEAGSVVMPNPNLKAEYAYNAEFGIAKVFMDKLKIDLTAYYTYLDNAMVRRDYQLNGLDSIIYDGELSQVQAIQNGAFAYIYGIQAGIEFKTKFGLGFFSQLNYQKGEEELDDGSKSSLRHAAPLFGDIHLSYTNKNLTLDGYIIYNGEINYHRLAEEERGKPYLYAIDNQGNPYAPAWYTLNIKTRYQINPTFTLSAGIENLTDQRYRPYSSGIAAAGRNYIFSMQAVF